VFLQGGPGFAAHRPWGLRKIGAGSSAKAFDRDGPASRAYAAFCGDRVPQR
jgi:hypothetical protein